MLGSIVSTPRYNEVQIYKAHCEITSLPHSQPIHLLSFKTHKLFVVFSKKKIIFGLVHTDLITLWPQTVATSNTAIDTEFLKEEKQFSKPIYCW
jgi:hypothetical protein